MTVLMPSDAVTTKMAVGQAARIDGPVYIRLTRDGVPVLGTCSPNGMNMTAEEIAGILNELEG